MKHTPYRWLALFALLLLAVQGRAQRHVLQGRISDEATGRGIEYASVLLRESGLWAVTDSTGGFTVQGVPQGSHTLTVSCLGYRERTLNISLTRDVRNFVIRLKTESLGLSEVTVTAQRKHDEATTSYSIDRAALDQQQILNIGDAMTLLPGGKTVNPSLMSDDRISLRSASGERGNASFGTAIEIDGVRLDNNAAAGETAAASTRSIGVADVERVEIVTGIPSVEYGDLSNGVVRVHSRKGKSPFIVEGKLNQHTRQLSLVKGADLGHRLGTLNVALEHARSFSDAASPHTAYQRNNLGLTYQNTLLRSTTPLQVLLGLHAGIGGYRNDADPDRHMDDYGKVRDDNLRLNAELNWQLARPWLTSLQLRGTLSHSDRKSEEYRNQNSATTLPYLHTTEEGYHKAEEYLPGGTTPAIVLGPTGYWYVKSFHDSKPLSYSLRLKGQLVSRQGRALNNLMAGAEYSGSRNRGKGSYYGSIATAPTWRPWPYNELPTMQNLALYVEDKLHFATTRRAAMELTAGLRHDLTHIRQSVYGTAQAFSPRFNTRYIFWRGQRKRWISDLQAHAGWGKSVKLPSMQVLYPTPSYSDHLAFAPASNALNKVFYAYHTYPQEAIRNGSLRWQYTLQTDLGVDFTLKGTHITLSAFHHKTFHPYMATSVYTPFAYKFTGQSQLEGIAIPSADRLYSIDRQTGVVTVNDQTGTLAPITLGYNERRTWLTNTRYVNASPVSRYGLEWVIDFAQIKSLSTQLRIDGNYYYYKGLDETFFQDVPIGLQYTQSDGQPYGYVGYYRGSNATSTGFTADASASNGFLSRQANLNATLTTHIPRLRLIMALRIETSLLCYRRAMSQWPDGGSRGIVVDDGSTYTGTPYDGTGKNQTIAVYPEYYTTWEHPDQLIPFAERFLWAQANDRQLYDDLSHLVVRTNYPYTMNPNHLSRYLSANFSVTKEIGSHVSVSFYANNFFNNMRRVRSSQTGLETSLFASGYIPAYYYGLSLKLKI